MESVIATVSGYHGTERFKVIKLIACTGANYVGAMDRSVTHLVCWQFEGRKYDLARKLGTHIISHCWFEDCLKEGRRLPEGPYTMQSSGQEVGPISWELPAILEGNSKKRCPFFGERNVESNHCKAMNSAKRKKINPVCLNWSDSHLLKENYFHGWDAKKMLSNSQGRKSRRILKKSHQSSRHQIAILDDTSSWPECSSRSSTRLSHRRNFHYDANGKIFAKPTDESSHAVKITEPVDLDKLRSKSASFALEKASETILYDNDGSRRIEHEEGIVETNDFSNLVDSDSSESCHVLTVEEDSKTINSVEVRGTDLCEAGDCDALSAPSGLDQQAELSCVICWTEFCSLKGVLPCGHRFCYSCIKEWSDCMALRGKLSTCPLCKANFTSITKFEELASSEQKIFSESIPCSSSKQDIFCLPGNRYDTFRTSHSDSICFECQNREPEDLLLSCHICQTQWVHSCCLDPPLIPWTCIHCRDLRMLYQRFR
ncbi:DNA topoisomerase 2-binding protein 1 isoform X1 [Dendrobium catenatum]|uniref:DNA topoisomerase 2-binding protein 1 isoform X1 n=1 Tax=Dendrobium catenatum TaxID=906689 RepID=UPI0009F48D3D|nr:DNA topoisomerase 2-binding protein 1 isoform X1 [Dendrobium catenatum]